MTSSADAFFLKYLRALSNKQLAALTEWQEERISGGSGDAVKKKQLIYNEIRRRNDS